jgi:hypothetical protein
VRSIAAGRWVFDGKQPGAISMRQLLTLLTAPCALIVGWIVCSAAQAAREPGPCGQISAACESAGFTKGGASAGKGLQLHCIGPIMQGRAQPAEAQLRLPTVDSKVVTDCKARNPRFGQATAAPTESASASPSKSVLPRNTESTVAADASPQASAAAVRSPNRAVIPPGPPDTGEIATLSLVKRNSGNIPTPADIDESLATVLGHRVKKGDIKSSGTLTLSNPVVSGLAVLRLDGYTAASFGGGSALLGEPRLMVGALGDAWLNNSIGTVHVTLRAEAHRAYLLTFSVVVLESHGGATVEAKTHAQFEVLSASKLNQSDDVALPNNRSKLNVAATLGAVLVASRSGLVTVTIQSSNSAWLLERCEISSVAAE